MNPKDPRSHPPEICRDWCLDGSQGVEYHLDPLAPLLSRNQDERIRLSTSPLKAVRFDPCPRRGWDGSWVGRKGPRFESSLLERRTRLRAFSGIISELPSDEFVAFQERFAVARWVRVGGHRRPGPPERQVVAGRSPLSSAGRPDLSLRQLVARWSDHRKSLWVGSRLIGPANLPCLAHDRIVKRQLLLKQGDVGVSLFQRKRRLRQVVLTTSGGSPKL